MKKHNAIVIGATGIGLANAIMLIESSHREVGQIIISGYTGKRGKKGKALKPWEKSKFNL